MGLLLGFTAAGPASNARPEHREPCGCLCRYQTGYERKLSASGSGLRLTMAGPNPNHRSIPSLSEDLCDPTSRSFQGLILTLQQFWAAQGCVVLQPYDMEVGAGTFHPGDDAARARAEALEGGLCAAVRAGRRMAAMARIPTGCSITISSRSS
jgi:hypothetical protein